MVGAGPPTPGAADDLARRRHDAAARARHIDGQLGFYSQDAECSIVAGTWPAAYWSAQCVLAAAADLLAGARSSFALCRPPGHHATARAMGGFCCLNNVAIAAHHQERQAPNGCRHWMWRWCGW
jgi:acetoin utilization deacetylase AcuC-like enzyme